MINLQTEDRMLQIAACAAKKSRRSTAMPILSYFAAGGAILIVLLFVADATLGKSTRLPNNSQFAGLPEPWKPTTPYLAANPAPEPDMTSEAVKAAAPPSAATNNAVATRTVKPDAKKRTRLHSLTGQAGERYAWRPGDNGAFRGSAFPWRF